MGLSMYSTDVQHPQSQMIYYRQSIGMDGQVDDKLREPRLRGEGWGGELIMVFVLQKVPLSRPTGSGGRTTDGYVLVNGDPPDLG